MSLTSAPRGAVASGCAFIAVLGACVSQVEVHPDTSGLVAALLIQTDGPGPKGVVSVRALEPFDSETSFAIGHAPSRTTMLLGYPQPLESYGLRFDRLDQLVRVEKGGVPLPPPSAMFVLGGDDAEPVPDVAAAWAERPFDGVRVAQQGCATLVEVPGSRIDMTGRGQVTMAIALDDSRALLSIAARARTDTATVVVLTATSARGLQLPKNLSLYGAYGFADTDGSVWMLAATADPAPPNWSPLMCHIAAGARSSPDCVAPEGETLDFLFTAVAGQRRADGRLEIAAIGFDGSLNHWLGDEHDRGEWVRLYTGGRYEQITCSTARPYVYVTLDGPGTGVASFESGGVERFRVTDAGVERTPLFELQGLAATSCRSTYGRHPLGAEVFVRVAKIETPFEMSITPRAVPWLRAKGQADWATLETEFRFEPASLTPMRDSLLASGAVDTVAALRFDTRRPDLSPQVCPPVTVFNDGSVMDVIDDETVLIAGAFELDGARSSGMARWRLVAP